MNSVNLLGRLTSDPELRYTPNGVAVANARLAVNGAGQFISEYEGYEAGFFPIVVWGTQAENFAEFCKKGREVAVSGRLSFRTFETNDGRTAFVTEVTASHIDFLREPQGNQEPSQSEPKGRGQSQAPRGNSNRGGARGGSSLGR